jgi:hypothetical protein
MDTADRIREVSILPSRFQIMLDHGLRFVQQADEREELCMVACAVSNASWRFWQAWRPPEDNRQEHEWIVFANIMKIGEGQLETREKRIATAFAFVHDSFPIKRVMKIEIDRREEEAKKIKKSNPERARQLQEEAQKLRDEDIQTRVLHMTGGAQNAEFALGQLGDPSCSDSLLLEPNEMAVLKDIIEKHDAWKIGESYPASDEPLALVCVEADLLWPLHPIGVLADVERPDRDGNPTDFNDTKDWKKKLDSSLRTIFKYTDMWRKIPGEAAKYGDNTMRTAKGEEILTEWRSLWHI